MTDIRELWDFENPAGSEDRFRAAASDAPDDERAILLTQVARALGLQERYDEGHSVLDELLLGPRTAAVDARIALERGRLLRSAGDSEAARPCFDHAAAVAERAGLEDLRVDAIHMLALLATEPADAVLLNGQALAVARAAEDPEARRWEASLLNNLGCALVDAGRLDDALSTFEEAYAVRSASGQHRETQIARWMVAWTLRLLGRTDEARQLQLALKAELDAEGTEDPYVDEELALLGPG